VDPEGQPIERAELQAPPAAGDDGDGEDASTEESA